MSISNSGLQVKYFGMTSLMWPFYRIKSGRNGSDEIDVSVIYDTFVFAFQFEKNP